VPRDDGLRRRLSPEYVTLSGWYEDISAVRSFEDLPENAKVYLAVSFAGMITVAASGDPKPRVIPTLDFVGVGPNPEQVITDAPDPAELFRIAAESGVLDSSVMPGFDEVTRWVQRQIASEINYYRPRKR
jgi:adenylosuccinate synthase